MGDYDQKSIMEGVIKQSIFRSSIPNHFIVVVPESGFFFAGQFQFQPLYGDVEVNGARINASPFDPARSVHLAVHNVANVPQQIKPLKVVKFDRPLLVERVRAVMESFSEQTMQTARAYGDSISVLLVNVTVDFKTSFLMDRIGDMFRPLTKYKRVRIGREAYIVYEMCGGVLSNTIDNDQLVPLVHSALCPNDPEVNRTVVITGGVNVGKSTITRYLVNKMASTGVPVYVLDTDLGQTEFTPMGCVSVTKVTEPILSPPFLHQQSDFSNCIFVGCLSPAEHVAHYQRAIAILLMRYAEVAEPSAVLVVNTMGWVEKLGRELNLDLIQYVKPSNILNMVIPGGLNMALNDNRVPSKTNVHTYYPPSRPNEKSSNDIRSKVWREYALSGYLTACFDDPRFGPMEMNRTFANLLARQVSFSRIRLYFHPDRSVADHLVLNALNCSVVALCSFVSDEDRNQYQAKHVFDRPGLPAIIPTSRRTPPLFRCLGFGLIRSISVELGRYYLVTPICDSSCSRVEVFVLGDGVQTPRLLFDKDDKDAPYIVRSAGDNQHKATKERQELIAKLYDGFSNTTGFRRQQRAGSPPKAATKRKHMI